MEELLTSGNLERLIPSFKSKY